MLEITRKTYQLDAHSDSGFCNAIRKADVQGKVMNNKFHVTYFKLNKQSNDKLEHTNLSFFH